MQINLRNDGAVSRKQFTRSEYFVRSPLSLLSFSPSISLSLSLCFIFSRTLYRLQQRARKSETHDMFSLFPAYFSFFPLLIFYHLSRDDVFSNKYAGSKNSIDAKYGYISMPTERGCPSSLFPTVLSSSRAPSISVTIRCSELLIAAVMKRGAEAKRRKRLKELASVGNETTAHR